MSTKSIDKNIWIKSKASCDDLISALEYAEKNCNEGAIIPKATTVSRDELKETLGGCNAGKTKFR